MASSASALEEAIRDAKQHLVPRMCEEKAVEKIPGRCLLPRKIRFKSLRTLILQKRSRGSGGGGRTKPPRFVFDDGGMSLAASTIANGKSVASRSEPAIVQVPDFSDNRSVASRGSSRFSKGSRKYIGLSLELMDVASVGSRGSRGSRGSYKKSQDDPPEAVLPRGLQFGTPLIMNRSQALEESQRKQLMRVEEDDFLLKQDENERLIGSESLDLDAYINKLGDTRFLTDEENATGSIIYRKPARLQNPDYNSKSSLDNDSSESNSANEFLEWYVKLERDIKRKKVAAAAICVFLSAFLVTLMVMFNNMTRNSSGNGEPLLSSSGDRSIPPRPSPPPVPRFDAKAVPLLPPSGEEWSEGPLKAMLEAFSHSNLLEDENSVQGKAYRWLLKSNLEAMNGMRVGQRYALAVFYYSCQERPWSVQTAWLSSDHECTWHGVGCGVTGRKGGTDARRQLVEGQAEKVTSIILSDNNLHGPLPSELKYLDSLRHLVLTENLVKGSIPEGLLAKLTSIETLYLDSNYMTGSIPDELDHMQSLKFLDLSGNSFESSIPTSIKSATNLVDARFSGNSFAGQIPNAFSALVNLSVFLAGCNDIEGEIPPSLGLSTSLVTLHLQENELKGSIPDFASAKLHHLHLDSNGLTGTIPALQASGTLEELRLEGNQLTGDIPASVGNIPKLKLLWLSRNQLTSTVPHELGRLEQLASLQIDRNKLVGSIPSSLCALKSYHELFVLRATCGNSNPGLQCDCCDSC